MMILFNLTLDRCLSMTTRLKFNFILEPTAEPSTTTLKPFTLPGLSGKSITFTNVPLEVQEYRGKRGALYGGTIHKVDADKKQQKVYGMSVMCLSRTE